MFKKIIYILLLSVIFTQSNALDTRPTLDSVSYDGYLSNDTIVKIKGKDLENCNSLKIKGTFIPIISKSNTEITYNYKSGNFNKGFIDLNCGAYLGSKEFNFPYIEDVEIDKDNTYRTYWINGKNFLNGTTVYDGLGTNLSYSKLSEVLIIGNIPEKYDLKNVYVVYNKLKSNLFNIDFKVPYINYLEAKDGFNPGKTVTLHGRNFNWDINSYVLVGQTKISNFKYDVNKSTVEFILPDLLGNNEIKFFGKGVGSNGIRIDVIGDRPVITNAYMQGEDHNGEYTEVLYIIGKRFNVDNENISLLNNGKTFSIASKSDEIIRVENFRLNSGNNFLYLDFNGVYSNIFNLYGKKNDPYINYIETDKLVGSKMVYKIGLENFDQNKDIIYYKNNKIKPLSCLSDSCKVEISANDLSGFFQASNEDGKKTLPKYFDISDGKYPVIYDIEFFGELKYGTKFKITGVNFEDATISTSNLVQKNEKGLYDLDIEPTIIEGRLSSNYNIKTKSSLSVSKYSNTANISFVGGNLTKTKYNGHGIIKDIKNSKGDKIIKQGENIEINGYGFHNDSKVLVGNIEHEITYKSPVQIFIKLSSDLKPGEYSFKIKNTLGDLSGGYLSYIFGANDSNNIGMGISTKSTKTFTATENYNDELLYSIKIDNFVNDLTISSLKYKINNYISGKDIGLFKLKLGSTLIGEAKISSQGILEFNNLSLDKKTSGNIISLHKSSPFYFGGTYDFKLESIEVYDRKTNKSMKNFDLSKISSYTLKVDDNISKCIDSLSDNSNCKNFTQVNNISEEKIEKNEETVKTPVETTKTKTELIYEKIDGIVESYIQKTSKKILVDQLNDYKNFSVKIKNIIGKNPNNPSKVYLEYFHKKIDEKYKKVFKEYVLSKK